MKAAGEFKGSPETIPALMQPPFGYKKEDAEKWLASTTYAEKPGEVSKKMLEETLEALKTAGVVKEIPDVANWAAEGVCKLV